ncbi:MAG: hypothetical protein DMF64_09265 [Acidobacteria bacterium]|nr:MAG: hypothetical protein DMF64_09265 [Acidobacteriota bacterium]
MVANFKAESSNLKPVVALLCALYGRSVASALRSIIRRKTTLAAICLFALISACPHTSNSRAQTPIPSLTPTPQVATTDAPDDPLTHAVNAVCTEREQDPQGSAAIDEMQARPSLPLLHADVLAGTTRAERLLPLAKTLATNALRALAREHRVSKETLQAAFARLAEVQRVKPDVELRDNASVYYQDPHTIHFGTLFLAGLRSDEGMISVLAHELTHVADGPRSTLAVLFRRVARQAGRTTQTRIAGHRAEELTCDLVGALAARAYIARTQSVEPLARRAARAVEHNCVTRDVTDTVHLSPRRTLRALLALNPALAREIMGEQQATLPPPRRVRGRRAAAHAPPR